MTKRIDDLSFKRGSIDGYVEARLHGDRVSGHLKPIFRDLDVRHYRDREGNEAARAFWKAVVGVAEGALDNDDKDQHAAVVPIQGTVEDPTTDVWTVLETTLRNAFVRAITPGFGRGGEG
jgi:hypothetical protein